jgi:hypothetical protein
VISPTQRPLPDNTQHYRETDIHAPGWIRTYILSRRATALPLESTGLQINESKTRVHTPAKKQQVAQRINVGEYNVEVVNEFTYLGNRLTNRNEELAAVQVQIQASNRAYFSILSIC